MEDLTKIIEFAYDVDALLGTCILALENEGRLQHDPRLGSPITRVLEAAFERNNEILMAAEKLEIGLKGLGPEQD